MTHFRVTRKEPGFSLDVDFPLPAGTTAIFGPPAAGKSLLLKLAAGLVTPAAGRILFEDAILYDAASRVDVPVRARGFGYLAHCDSLFPHITLRDNLRFAAQNFPRLDRHRRIAESLDRWQLANAAGLYPRQLSPEQKLRGAIARMLLAEPRLLLLDHAGLSEVLLRQIRALTAAPILFATRDLDLCCAAAGHMVVLDAGRIAQSSAPRDVVDHPGSVEVAHLTGIPNVYQGSIAALDPGRHTSVIQFEHFSLNAPYLPARFRGDQIRVAIRPRDLRVHPASSGVNCIAGQLVCVSFRAESVRLEFEYGIFADLSLESYAAQKDNKEWHIEFPPDALQIL